MNQRAEVGVRLDQDRCLFHVHLSSRQAGFCLFAPADHCHRLYEGLCQVIDVERHRLVLLLVVDEKVMRESGEGDCSAPGVPALAERHLFLAEEYA